MNCHVIFFINTLWSHYMNELVKQSEAPNTVYHEK